MTDAPTPLPATDPASPREVVVVLPVFNDWESLGQVLGRLGAAFASAVSAGRYRLRVLAVDDGSSLAPDDARLKASCGNAIHAVDVLHLTTNVGHQRAIAIGLAAAVAQGHFHRIVVMDGDGEDRPEDVPGLLARSEDAGEGSIVIAERRRRSEGLGFRVGYAAYRLAFRVLTGGPIRFGNFSVLPAEPARRLVSSPSIWNHFAAGIVASKVPLVACPTDRGTRVAGRSHMNVPALVVHGLSAVAVHQDTVAVRLLLLSLATLLAAVTGLAAVVGIKLLTALAIPGWASTLGMLLVVAGLQALLLSTLLAFVILSGRSQRLFIPAQDASNFVRERRTLP